MSTTEPQWNAGSPAPKSSNRSLWWIVGIAAFGVLGLIAIAATIVVPNVMASRDSAYRSKARVELTTLHAAVEGYRLSKGAYPSSWSELFASGQTVPRDPWGHDYVLLAGEDLQTRPRLFSYGRDGAFGGYDEDADIEHIPR